MVPYPSGDHPAAISNRVPGRLRPTPSAPDLINLLSRWSNYVSNPHDFAKLVIIMSQKYPRVI